MSQGAPRRVVRVVTSRARTRCAARSPGSAPLAPEADGAVTAAVEVLGGRPLRRRPGHQPPALHHRHRPLHRTAAGGRLDDQRGRPATRTPGHRVQGSVHGSATAPCATVRPATPRDHRSTAVRNAHRSAAARLPPFRRSPLRPSPSSADLALRPSPLRPTIPNRGVRPEPRIPSRTARSIRNRTVHPGPKERASRHRDGDRFPRGSTPPDHRGIGPLDARILTRK